MHEHTHSSRALCVYTTLNEFLNFDIFFLNVTKICLFTCVTSHFIDRSIDQLWMLCACYVFFFYFFEIFVCTLTWWFFRAILFSFSIFSDVVVTTIFFLSSRAYLFHRYHCHTQYIDHSHLHNTLLFCFKWFFVNSFTFSLHSTCMCFYWLFTRNRWNFE